jgi:3-oxoacyl-[acyl-carrier-protein] synthase-3
MQYAQQPHIRNILLLDGETRSRVYHPKDRKVAFIFGDGAVAALVQKKEGLGPSWFSLNSDGSREDLIKIDAGGYRTPSSPETLKEKVVDEYGNIRTDEHGYMSGSDVFNFVIREIPRDLKNLYSFAGVDKEQIDYFLFHQANKFMNNYLRKKLRLNKEKISESISKFGNTSSVSIPLTMVNALQGKLIQPKTVLMSGFGVGMSWASAIMPFENCVISDLVEVD